MKVHYYNYRRMHEFLYSELMGSFRKVLFLNSDEELFKYQYYNEKKIGKFFGRGYSRGTSSGTAALNLTLVALGIGKGDEVITVPHTFIATALAISDSGARPVFVDVLPGTMLIDSSKIEEKITKRTKAIMPVHLYGQMANIDKIVKIAKKYRLHVVEDACQSHLARYNGRLAGEKTDAACYSFFINKALGGLSNGGMVITKKWKIYKNLEVLRNPTSGNPLLLKSIRTPSFLDWSQIPFIKSKIKYLKRWTERRREIAGRYLEGLRDLPLRLPAVDKKAYHVFATFAIRTKKRDRLRRFLKKQGIETKIHYPEPCHLSKTFKYLGYRKGDFPVSEAIAKTVLSIPINPFLSDEEIAYVIKNIKHFFL